MLNLPIISVGLVNNLPASAKLLFKIVSAPKVINIDRRENTIKLKIKVKYIMLKISRSIKNRKLDKNQSGNLQFS